MIYSLDIETRPTVNTRNLYALEPWRLRQGLAEISSIAVCNPDNKVSHIVNDGTHDWRSQVIDLLRELEGKIVYAHNTVFDTAWLIATLQTSKCKPVSEVLRNIRWRDTMLLGKWLINGQLAEDSDFSYSLLNMCKVFLSDHSLLSTFVAIKEKKIDAGDDADYWLARGDLDVIMTKALAEKLQTHVPDSMRVGIMTEFNCLLPIANSWINGIKIDVNKIEEVEKILRDKMKESLDILHVDAGVLSSPKQLGNLLFNEWGLKPRTHNATGPSTCKGDLMWIQYDLQNTPWHNKINAVMDFKKNNTLVSKYIKTLKEALEYTGDGYIYGIPRVFATYTGRMSYSNTTIKDGPKVSIALHQMPRKAKEIRSLMRAPEGFGLLEDDASGQESRLMAIRSGDPVMLKVFQDDLNFHSMTGAAIIGMDYYEFQEKYKAEGDEGYHVEQRQLGKLTNLSCNYRIGGKSLSEKAFITYDTYMTEETGRFLVNTFKRQYRGVVQYWDDTIMLAKQQGYTECFGGRRYKINKWSGRDAWGSESSSINFPIQGGGASMKEIAISQLFKAFPEVYFALDLHDATFSFCEIDKLEELNNEVLDYLNKIDYEPFWGFKPTCPLTYESAYGVSFRDVK